MKRTLALLFAAVASAALAQTPTVVEKPAANSATTAKPAAAASTKTPAQSSKPSPTAVKVVAVPAPKPGAVVAKPTAVPVQSASAQPKAVTVASAKTSAPASAKPVAVAAVKPGAAKTATTTAAPAATKTVAVPAKPAVVTTPAAHVAAVSAKPSASGSSAKPVASVKSDPFKSAAAQKAPVKVSSTPVAVATRGAGKSSPASHTTVAVQDNKDATEKKPAKVINAASRRDPFVSPVVAMGASGSGCSSGKRCLAIDQIALRGVVRSDGGMIAVVVNAMDKAYFLRENDPVFNGYVLKITGDSVVFKETFHDKLGKPLTRDVTKTLNRPVA